MSQDLFRRANHLWFQEGRTEKALRAYEEASQVLRRDPVVAFQHARVLWCVDRFDEARSQFSIAFAKRHEFDATGQAVIQHWHRQFHGPPPQRYFSQFPPTMLDRDHLDAKSLSEAEWRIVADAASSREMYGLAVYALSRWNGVPIDAEDAKDIGKIETNRDLDEAMLVEMNNRRSFLSKPETYQSAPQRSARGPGSNNPLCLERPIHNQLSADIPIQPSQRPMPYNLPLNLCIAVSPEIGRVGIETTVVARLSNPTDLPQLINSRMLVNHFGQPGEVWFDLQCPDSYRNRVGYRIRVGHAPSEFIVYLEPGATVTKSWTLNDYQSLDTPGEYVLTVTYHNETATAPDSRALAVGQVSATARFRRT